MFDLINCGPRHRFTILTDRGPIIVSNCVQSSGHDIQMMIIEETINLRAESGIQMQGIVWDFHDQSIVQVKEKDADAMVKIFKEAYRRMNIRLKKMNPEFFLDIKGDPAIVYNLAEAKIQE